MDGDGDTDVVGGSNGEERIFWFENMGGKQGGEDARKESLAAGEAVRGDAGEAATFQEHPITLQGADSGAQGPLRTSGSSLDFADFNADGRLDVITVALEPKGAIFWLEQPSDPAQPWPVHHVGTIAPDHATGIAVADVNADERPDVIVGGYSRGPSEEDSEEVTPSDPVGRIAWFANPEDATKAWARHDISRRQRGTFDSFVPLDIDDDGDIDFIGTRGNSGGLDGVFWLQQMFSGVRRVPSRRRERKEAKRCLCRRANTLPGRSPKRKWRTGSCEEIASPSTKISRHEAQSRGWEPAVRPSLRALHGRALRRAWTSVHAPRVWPFRKGGGRAGARAKH